MYKKRKKKVILIQFIFSPDATIVYGTMITIIITNVKFSKILSRSIYLYIFVYVYERLEGLFLFIYTFCFVCRCTPSTLRVQLLVINLGFSERTQYNNIVHKERDTPCLKALLPVATVAVHFLYTLNSPFAPIDAVRPHATTKGLLYRYMGQTFRRPRVITSFVRDRRCLFCKRQGNWPTSFHSSDIVPGFRLY